MSSWLKDSAPQKEMFLLEKLKPLKNLQCTSDSLLRLPRAKYIMCSSDSGRKYSALSSKFSVSTYEGMMNLMFEKRELFTNVDDWSLSFWSALQKSVAKVLRLQETEQYLRTDSIRSSSVSKSVAWDNTLLGFLFFLMQEYIVRAACNEKFGVRNWINGWLLEQFYCEGSYLNHCIAFCINIQADR